MNEELKQVLKGRLFEIPITMTGDFKPEQIKQLLPNYIMTFFNQFQKNSAHSLSKEDIEVVDYQIIDLNTNTKTVFAYWKVV